MSKRKTTATWRSASSIWTIKIDRFLSKKMVLIALFSIGLGVSLFSQAKDFKIALLIEDETSSKFFLDLVKSEINTLLSTRYEYDLEEYHLVHLDPKTEGTINEIYSNKEMDLVIGIGLGICNTLARKDSFSIPTILSIILDNELQQIAVTPEGTSGMPNLTYIQTPFNIERDFKKFHEIYPYKRIGLLGNDVFTNTGLNMVGFYNKMLEPLNATFDSIFVNGNAEATLAQIKDDVDAVYVTPILDALPPAEIKKLYDGLAERNLPSFAFLSSPDLGFGAFAGYDTEDNLRRIPRRVAINTLKILEGQKPEELAVEMDNFTENLIINMETVKRIGVWPNWDIMAESVLINVNEVPNGRVITFRSAIAEGLQNNLGYKIAEKETQIIAKDVDLARSNYLPTLEGSVSGSVIDETTVQTSFGFRGTYNLSAQVTLSQLLFSEPALANITIQKLLFESQQESQEQNKLDLVLDLANAYLGILQASELFNLRNQNLKVTRQNYDIAQAKEQVGYSGTNDVYRLQSELALDNVDLNNADAQLQQARYSLNSLLNRPINEPFKLGDVNLSDSILLVLDPRLILLVDNPGKLEVFSDFLVQEAFQQLPEISQLELALAAQERNLLSKKRAFYMPSVVLQGEYNFPIDAYDFPETVTPMELQETYSGVLAVQIPIYQGHARVFQQQQAKVQVLQLQDQLSNLRNQLEAQIRGSLRQAGASFSNLELSRQAAEAASKNFQLIQDSYQQGLINITSLIDAQNAALQAEINATTAEYVFIQDFLAVERLSGSFYSLSTPEENDAFFQRLMEFLTNN